MDQTPPPTRRAALPLLAILIVLGAAAIIVGTALYDWRAAIIVGGLLVLVAGVDLAREP